MERLTDKLRGLCLSCELSIDDDCDHLHHNEFCENAKRYDRLADIEDILGDDYDLDWLEKLVERDVFSTPLKVGDTVYVLTHGGGCLPYSMEIVECKVNTMRIKSDGCTIGYSCRGRYKNGNPYLGNFVFKSIGETVFLTVEDAMAALEGEKDG